MPGEPHIPTVGEAFPDLDLPDHTGRGRLLSEIAADDPLVLIGRHAGMDREVDEPDRLGFDFFGLERLVEDLGEHLAVGVLRGVLERAGEKEGFHPSRLPAGPHR